jgi:flagellar basal-body rod protein FlgG
MRSCSDALDILSNNLANLNTAGYKGEKHFFSVLGDMMKTDNPEGSIVGTNIVQAQSAIDSTIGSLRPTGRDLDIAIDGNGFIAVKQDQVMNYTRNGHLGINEQSMLCAAGLPVMGENGNPIVLGSGSITINNDGEVYQNGNRLDRIKIVEFRDPALLVRKGNSLFAVEDDKTVALPSASKIVQGYIEQSNVNAVSCVVNMVSLMRQFESMQKSFNVLMNEINAKAIEKLSR